MIKIGMTHFIQVLASLTARFLRPKGRIITELPGPKPHIQLSSANVIELGAFNLSEITPSVPSSGPIFIGGTGRSGTTILARLLGEHPKIFMLRWESQLIVAEGGLINLLEQIESDKAAANFSSNLRGEWFERTLFAGMPNEYTAGLSYDIPWGEVEVGLKMLSNRRLVAQNPSARLQLGRDFLNAIFTPATIRHGATRWGEKTPRNIFYIDQLWKIFPNMRFIHIIRDGRDVVASMLQNGFWPIAPSPAHPTTMDFQGQVSFRKAINYWVTMLEIARRSAAKVPRENYLELRLEDLVTQSDVFLPQLMDFLNEEIDPKLLSFRLNRSNSQRWKQDLSPKQIQYFHEHAGHVLEREGYEVIAN